MIQAGDRYANDISKGLAILATLLLVIAGAGPSFAQTSVDGVGCAAAYASVAKQIDQDKQPRSGILAAYDYEMFSRYPAVTSDVVKAREAALLSRSEVAALRDRDRAQYLERQLPYRIEPAYDADDPLKPYKHPEAQFKAVFSLLTLCDKKFGFSPTIDILAYGGHAEPKVSKPDVTASNTLCGAHYLLAGEALKAANPQAAQIYYNRVNKLAADEAGSTDRRRLDRYIQTYIREGRNPAQALQSGALSVRRLDEILRVCDAAYSLESVDMSPYYR